MRKYFIILACLILISSTVISIQSLGEEEKILSSPTRGQLDFGDGNYQYRSMWLEGYQIVNISEVRTVVDYARRYNFNCLSPLINGDHRGVFYNSSIYPKHPDVRWDFDPLMELIREAHKYGIQVHPWWHTMIERSFYYENPEWGVVSSSGYRSTAWINPAYPEARSHVRNATMEVVSNYPIDGIKLDTIRYPSSAYSFDDYSIEKFNNSGLTDYNEFRRMQITETVELIYNSIMERKPWLWVSADVFSSSWSRANGVFQEPEVWSDAGLIDYITPMLYTTSTSSYSSNLENDLNTVSCPIVAGTYIYIPGNTAHGSVPNETAGIELMLEQVNISNSLGAWGICGFAYKFLREYPSYGRALRDGPFSLKAQCPLKEQDRPVEKTRWDFDIDHDREGWNIYDSGHFYPEGGVWSISGSKRAKLLSPRLNFSSSDINVIEISMLIEEGINCSLRIYWGQIKAVIDENRMIERKIMGDGEWGLHSIHLDGSSRWDGMISYLFIVPQFETRSNITIDLVSLHWMPYCIREFSYLGPFTVGGDQDLMDRKFIENEGQVFPRPGDTQNGRQWRTHSFQRDLVDFRFLFGTITYNVVYSHIFVRSDKRQELELRAGSSDGIKVWVNGDLRINSSISRPVSPDQNVATVTVEKGMNSLFVKLAGYLNEFSYYLRFTSPGNDTADGLRYFNSIPVIDAPDFHQENQFWSTSKDIDLSWSAHSTITDIDHSIITLDLVFLKNTSSSYVTLNNLSDGHHNICVRAVDELGFMGNDSTLEFGVDTVSPLISGPHTELNHTKNIWIDWNWTLLREPVSGMDGYEVIVTYGQPGSYFTTLEPEMIRNDHYRLSSRIVDGFAYYMRVRSISNSGRVFSSKTAGPVVVDITPPPPPTMLRSHLLDPVNMTYVIEWDKVDDNVMDGLDHYEVVIDNGTGEVNILETKSSSFYFRRVYGSNPSFRVRGVDKAGNIGVTSKPFKLDLVKPKASIGNISAKNAGELISIGSEGSSDPDGKIISYQWIVNEELLSTDEELFLTLEKGVYNILLKVTDDIGMSDRDEMIIQVENEEDGSFRYWLVSNSIKDHMLPVINKTVPVYTPEKEEKVDPLITARSDLIGLFLPLFSGLFAISILIYFSFLYKRMRLEEGKRSSGFDMEEKDEWGGPPNWRRFADENALRSRSYHNHLKPPPNPNQTMNNLSTPNIGYYLSALEPDDEIIMDDEMELDEIDMIDEDEIVFDEFDDLEDYEELEELEITDWDEIEMDEEEVEQ
jgi:uncharacterized lipoprotein YddW (UPF0748 family)